MGRLHLNSGELVSCNLEMITEDNGYQVLHLELESEKIQVKYRICHDTREPDLTLIKNDIQDTLDSVLEKDNDLMLDEYPERHYIFITLKDGTRKQYTAQRI
jgi:hypothetical protein